MELTEVLKQAKLSETELGSTVQTISSAINDWQTTRGLYDVHPTSRLIPRTTIQQYKEEAHKRQIQIAETLTHKLTREIESLENDTTVISKTLEREIGEVRSILKKRAEDEQTEARASIDELSRRFEEKEKAIEQITQEISESSLEFELHESKIEEILTVPTGCWNVGEVQPPHDTAVSNASLFCSLTEDLIRARIRQTTDLREDVNSLERELEFVRDRHGGAINLVESAREFRRRIEQRQCEEEEKRSKRFALEERERRDKIARLEEMLQQDEQLDKEIPAVNILPTSSVLPFIATAPERRLSSRRLSSSSLSQVIDDGAIAWSYLSPQRNADRKRSRAQQNNSILLEEKQEQMRKRVQTQLEELRTQVNSCELKIKEAEAERTETLMNVMEMLADVVPFERGVTFAVDRILRRLFGRTHIAPISNSEATPLQPNDGVEKIISRKCAAAAAKAEIGRSHDAGFRHFNKAVELLVNSDVLTDQNGTLHACCFEE